MLEDEKVKLLLIDDDADFRKSLKDRLTKRNFTVTAVESAEEALIEINSNYFDIIISDIRLKGMDGLEFLSRVKKIDENIPVILITGYANLQTAKEAVALNAFSYLIKPLDNLSDLLIPIKNAVTGYRLKIENNNLKEHYENIVSSVPDGILTLDVTGIIKSVNKPFLKMFNLIENKLLNKNIEKIFDIRVTEYINILMGSIGLENNIVWFEWTNFSKPDNRFWTNITLKRTIIDNEEGILMIVSDISDYKKSEEAKKYIELQYFQMQKQESLGSLTHGIAHEFNNILSIILGHTQLCMTEDTSSDIKQSLTEIEKATVRGSNLVENMTTFANPNIPELKSQKIQDVIEEVIKMQNRQLRLQNIEIERKFSNKLIAKFDSSHMEQVFLNLLINAMHAIKPKGKGKITISIRDKDENVIIIFADTGIGMEENTMKKIFDPFFTTKGAFAKDEYNITGTGLGLSVTRGIIKQHNGTITVSSKKNEGTTFTITLPADTIIKPNTEAIAKDQSDINTEKLKNMRILLVDDEEDMVKLMKLIFKKAGFQNVLIEDNGKKAIASLNSFNPDIVFLDMIMPDMNGKEIFKKIKTINRDVPIVFMSGKLNLKKSEIMQEGSFDFIKKPFNINDLYRILSRLSSGNGMITHNRQ